MNKSFMALGVAVVAGLATSLASARPFEDGAVMGVRAFDDAPWGVIDPSAGEIWMKRSRLVTIDSASLFGDGVVRGEGATDRLVLNLFDDTVIEAVRKPIDLALGDTPLWYGELPETVGGGYALFVQNGEAIAGRIFSERLGRFEIDHVGAGIAAIREVDTPNELRCAVNHNHTDVARALRGEAEMPERRGVMEMPLDDAGDVSNGTFQFADVLVVYTAVARANIGGTPAMLAWIDAEIAETNLTYQNSGINARVRLAGTSETGYTQNSTDMGIDLNLITGVGDGVMDDVHALRNSTGADFVALIVHGATNACGIAWLMTFVSQGFNVNAFSVTARTCSGYVLAHELGHNMGCAHDRDNAGGASYPYAYGYRSPGATFRTVMAYSPGVWIPHWSNPNVLYNGAVTGVPTNQPNPCHNAQAINNNAPTFTAWRQSFTAPPAAFSLTTPSSGQTTPTRYPTFSWSESDQTDYYILEVDNNSNFSSPEIVQEPLTGTSYTPSSQPPVILQPGVQYFWRVTAVNPLGTRSSSPVSSNFTPAAVAPGSFVMQAPAAASPATSRNPVFQWSISSNTDGYTIVVDDNSDFSSPVINVSNIAIPSYAWNGTPLPPLTRFYWKVSSTNAIGTTDASTGVQFFDTAGALPSGFALLTPADGPDVTTRTPTLSWSTASFALNYRVLVDDSLALDSPEVDAVVTGTSYNVPFGSLQNNTRYYWQVRAQNVAGSTVSSPSISTFAVVVPGCFGDSNGDQNINFGDISTTLANWGTTGPNGDSNMDMQVNFADISTILSLWGTPCR